MSYYHILRENNEEEDRLVNHATKKELGTLVINNEVIWEPFP
jgi:hypothetical protein